MSTIVQKYGGSSVATAAHIRRVAARVVETRRAGHQVVVVVSAMGDSTDELLSLAHSVSPNPQRRELDMLLSVGERISISLLSMAIHDLGCPCVSFTGSQSGIITTDNHTNARIVRVTPVRIRTALDAGRIVIVAGFQGVSERLEITTLGRGGTDTTAVALAAALDADYAEICSDVDGVYTADPRIAPAAQRLDTVSYDEMQTLADAGAKVLNAEAVEWARRNNIEIRCAKTHGRRAPGTRIRAAAGLKRQRVVGITAHPGLLVVQGVIAPGELDTLLTDHGVADPLIWRMADQVTAMIPRQNLHGTAAFVAAVLGHPGLTVREDLTWVTVAGRALLSPPGIAKAAREVLQEANVSAVGELLDPGRITFLVKAESAPLIVRALHESLLEGRTADRYAVNRSEDTAGSGEGL